MRDIEDLGSAIVVKVERFGLQSLGLAQKETLLDILVIYYKIMFIYILHEFNRFEIING
jgi:hypothetical protein